MLVLVLMLGVVKLLLVLVMLMVLLPNYCWERCRHWRHRGHRVWRWLMR